MSYLPPASTGRTYSLKNTCSHVSSQAIQCLDTSKDTNSITSRMFTQSNIYLPLFPLSSSLTSRFERYSLARSCAKNLIECSVLVLKMFMFIERQKHIKYILKKEKENQCYYFFYMNYFFLNFHCNYKHVVTLFRKKKSSFYLGLQYISVNHLDPEKNHKSFIVYCIIPLEIYK